MKLADILLEASRDLFVIQSGDVYRVDPNPDHSVDQYKNAWTGDISQAHVFKEKAARRFLSARATIAQRRSTVNDKLRMVRVEMDSGKVVLPQQQNQVSFFDRFRRAA